MFVQPFNAIFSIIFVVNPNLSINFQDKFLAIILFGPELALHNVFSFSLTSQQICVLQLHSFCICFLLGSILNLLCGKEYKHFFTAVDNLIFYIIYIVNCN